MKSTNAPLEIRREVTVPCQVGLTLRVAARLMGVARRYKAEMAISNEKLVADAKSVVSMLMLGATRGKVLSVTARGKDAEKAMAALVGLFENDDDLCQDDKREK